MYKILFAIHILSIARNKNNRPIPVTAYNILKIISNKNKKLTAKWLNDRLYQYIGKYHYVAKKLLHYIPKGHDGRTKYKYKLTKSGRVKLERLRRRFGELIYVEE